MARFAVGLDFGTESARMVLVDVETGAEAETHAFVYPHGVMVERLPDGRMLPPDWALQHPADYLAAAEALLARAVRAVGASAVTGIGIDFTSCTMLPARRDGTPLCLVDEYAPAPHAWVKLWKHHAAQRQADRLNALAPDFLDLYGGRTSSEWLIAKSLQILEEAPEVFEAADRIIEGGDWIVWQLTGQEVRSACQAGYKAHWQPDRGYPEAAVLASLHPALPALLDKLAPPQPVGAAAGRLTPGWAKRTGLRKDVPVGVAVIDAHAAVPGLGVADSGRLVMVLGTSTCHLLLSRRRAAIHGISGVVRDSVLPGLYCYEAGQAATGDALDWWVRTLSWAADAEGPGVGGRFFERLEAEGAGSPPGAAGLVAVDWWNGSRTPLVDAALSAVLAGLTIGTGPGDIYRAVVEATAYGARQVIEVLEHGGAIEPITELRVCGGLTRSPFVMQLYADVTGRTLQASPTPHASARGAAIYGALAAAGTASGGPEEPHEAIERMAVRDFRVYDPDPRARAPYDDLYGMYRELHRHFGEGGTTLIRRLRERRVNQRRRAGGEP